MRSTNLSVAAIAFLLMCASAFGQASGGAEPRQDRPKAPAKPQAPKAKAPQTVGYRYAIVTINHIVIYADGPISVLQGGERRDYQRGTLLILQNHTIRNLGRTPEDRIAAAIGPAAGISQDFANDAATVLRRQPSLTESGCTRDKMSFSMLVMMGSIVGASAGMTLFSDEGISVTIPECASQ